MTKPQQLTTVTLLKAHTHKGKRYAKDDTIDVNAVVHQWLVKQGIVAAPAGVGTKKAGDEK